jgi:hypothetical protein
MLAGRRGLGDLIHRLREFHFETEELDQVVLALLMQASEIILHTLEIAVPGFRYLAKWTRRARVLPSYLRWD